MEPGPVPGFLFCKRVREKWNAANFNSNEN